MLKRRVISRSQNVSDWNCITNAAFRYLYEGPPKRQMEILREKSVVNAQSTGSFSGIYARGSLGIANINPTSLEAI